ncbi:MAG: glutathione S-transferase N-terminal domain-containing protein [Gammaproteobacteria bacterium]|nr:glutathione S-transferase N-terminal domain-containing protein [Gammaproteobacteria bacterium]
MNTVKRSAMTLYSDATGINSHKVRIVLAEKGVAVDILHVDSNNPPVDLLELNPYGNTPTLLDRELVLYEPQIIMEYLDERFPHPPLLPVYPIARAKCRLMMHRIEQDWMQQAYILENDKSKKAAQDKARESLQEQLISVSPLFAEMPFFLSEEFSLVDCYLAPLLWRLPKYGIELPTKAKAITNYAKNLFARESFQSSLSELEREIREDL